MTLLTLSLSVRPLIFSTLLFLLHSCITFLSLYLNVYLSISVCICICLSLSLSLFTSSFRQSVCLSLSLSPSLSPIIYGYIYLSVILSVRLSVCVFDSFSLLSHYFCLNFISVTTFVQNPPETYLMYRKDITSVSNAAHKYRVFLMSLLVKWKPLSLYCVHSPLKDDII